MRDFSSRQKLFAADDSPYELSTNLKPGTRYEARPPYPNVTIKSSTIMHVRSLVYQALETELEDTTDGTKESIGIGRLVAIVEGGDELEIHRTILPGQLEMEESVDPNICCACNEKIPIGAAVNYSGKPYHRRCLR